MPLGDGMEQSPACDSEELRMSQFATEHAVTQPSKTANQNAECALGRTIEPLLCVTVIRPPAPARGTQLGAFPWSRFAVVGMDAGAALPRGGFGQRQHPRGGKSLGS